MKAFIIKEFRSNIKTYLLFILISFITVHTILKTFNIQDQTYYTYMARITISLVSTLIGCLLFINEKNSNLCILHLPLSREKLWSLKILSGSLLVLMFSIISGTNIFHNFSFFFCGSLFSIIMEKPLNCVLISFSFNYLQYYFAHLINLYVLLHFNFIYLLQILIFGTIGFYIFHKGELYTRKNIASPLFKGIACSVILVVPILLFAESQFKPVADLKDIASICKSIPDCTGNIITNKVNIKKPAFSFLFDESASQFQQTLWINKVNGKKGLIPVINAETHCSPDGKNIISARFRKIDSFSNWEYKYYLYNTESQKCTLLDTFHRKSGFSSSFSTVFSKNTVTIVRLHSQPEFHKSQTIHTHTYDLTTHKLIHSNIIRHDVYLVNAFNLIIDPDDSSDTLVFNFQEFDNNFSFSNIVLFNAITGKSENPIHSKLKNHESFHFIKKYGHYILGETKRNRIQKDSFIIFDFKNNLFYRYPYSESLSEIPSLSSTLQILDEKEIRFYDFTECLKEKIDTDRVFFLKKYNFKSQQLEILETISTKTQKRFTLFPDLNKEQLLLLSEEENRKAITPCYFINKNGTCKAVEPSETETAKLLSFLYMKQQSFPFLYSTDKNEIFEYETKTSKKTRTLFELP